MPTTRKNTTPEKPVEPQDAVAEDEQLDVAGLEQKLADLQRQAAELQAIADAAKPATPTESTPLPDGRLASEATDDEVARAEVLRDPFDSTNALKILANPPRKMLRWSSITYREGRPMRGWQAVRYDDAIGRELHRYIGEPPARMTGTAALDNVVRRGDVFLAWIDRGIWLSRQRKREAEANRRIASHVTTDQQPIGKYAKTTDIGLRQDVNPYQESRVAPGFVRAESDYRARAKGTVEDTTIKTPGRNMFEAVEEE